MKLRFVFSFFTLFFLISLLCGCEDNNVSLVKESFFPGYQTKDIGTLVDDYKYSSHKEWKTKTIEDRWQAVDLIIDVLPKGTTEKQKEYNKENGIKYKMVATFVIDKNINAIGDMEGNLLYNNACSDQYNSIDLRASDIMDVLFKNEELVLAGSDLSIITKSCDLEIYEADRDGVLDKVVKEYIKKRQVGVVPNDVLSDAAINCDYLDVSSDLKNLFSVDSVSIQNKVLNDGYAVVEAVAVYKRNSFKKELFDGDMRGLLRYCDLRSLPGIQRFCGGYYGEPKVESNNCISIREKHYIAKVGEKYKIIPTDAEYASYKNSVKAKEEWQKTVDRLKREGKI